MQRQNLAKATPPIFLGLIAGFREISVSVGVRGGAERNPTSGRINGLQKVRVEMDLLSGKGDFCPTRTPAPSTGLIACFSEFFLTP